MELPGIEERIVAPLVTTLGRVTNSYKFLFFKGILDSLNITGRSLTIRNPIPLWELYAMVFVNAWYPVSRFRLSLGAADPIPAYVHKFAERHKDVKIVAQEAIPLFAPGTGEPDLLSLSEQLDKYVKYRFVRPWLDASLKGVPDSQINKRIAALLAEDYAGPQLCPYHFIEGDDGSEYLKIAPHFEQYLRQNAAVIYDWWRWKFANFLSARNPYTPNILSKLEPLVERDLNLARFFWSYVRSVAPGTLKCIYTGEPIGDTFSIDHFIPWSFVLHDRLWNLVPTAPTTNSSKSDGLAPLESFREPFINMQIDTLVALTHAGTHLPDRINQDVLRAEYTITDGQPSLLTLLRGGRSDDFRALLGNTLESLWINARNQGFPVWSRVA
ncbi:MAG: hypothetical protein JNM27_17010 [Leptospirales bacterium]|nr:hypothetical protein [Leptospirales bacterium]